uniref:Uncharacterized protein n=1 Tax=Alexandrium monilatum TaxID=311494 RepID=A0A7S4T3A4_9DINO
MPEPPPISLHAAAHLPTPRRGARPQVRPGAMGLRAAAAEALHGCSAGLSRDWSSGVLPISMMGLQAQTVAGSMVSPIQAVYLVQFGARAGIISAYLALALPTSLLASCLTAALLVGVSIHHARKLFVLGCLISLAASIALIFPPAVWGDQEQQAGFLSHYFGVLSTLATIGSKLRDYPTGLARVYILQSTPLRASEKAYTTVLDVMVGNALNGALMLSVLASPTVSVKLGLVALQVISTAISLGGASVLPAFREACHARGSVQETRHKEASADARQRPVHVILPVVLRLTRNAQLWLLLVIEWCVGFIFTLNSQAVGAVYWSSVVGVDDSLRSVYIALESALGGGLLGLVATLYVTRLYHLWEADVLGAIQRVVVIGAVLGAVVLAFLGTTSMGALLGITLLYLYYFVFPWTNIEFLKLLDTMKGSQFSDDPLVYMFLIKDMVGGLLNNIRNVALMWLLAATGFYEPDCTVRCSVAPSHANCTEQCHAEAHASVTAATTGLVRALYVVVMPGAYLLACFIMGRYAAAGAREARAGATAKLGFAPLDS